MEVDSAMKTRRLSGIGVGALALTIAIFGVSAFALQAAPQAKKIPHTEHDAVMQDCAKACADCQRACDMCATHCAHLLADGKKEQLECLRQCQDCASCCVACDQICARGGPHAAVMAGCCVKCCEECAKACEAFPDDAHIKACAEECRKCEKVCKGIAKQMVSK